MGSRCEACDVSWSRQLAVCPRCGEPTAAVECVDDVTIVTSTVWLASRLHPEVPYDVQLMRGSTGCRVRKLPGGSRL
jgi:uncharacterized OB-fold protein